MNYLKRGFASIVRKPGKTIILLAIIFMLGNIIAGTISVRQAVEKTELNLRTKMSPIASISRDYGNLPDDYSHDPEINQKMVSAEAIERIGELPFVKYFDYSAMVSLESPSLRRYSEYSSYSEIDFEEINSLFTLTGVHDPDILDLKEEKIRLLSGRVFSEQEVSDLEYVILVSQSFANANGLTVGSVVTLENAVYGNLPDERVSQNYDFEIIGIFEPVRHSHLGDKNEDNPNQWVEEEMENRIYAPNRVLIEANTYQINELRRLYPETSYTTDEFYITLYILHDPMDLEEFIEAAAVFLPEGYVMVGGGSFDQVAAPMRTIQGISVLILYVAVGAAVVVISLLMTLFLRDRKREMGIYLSLGERKIKIAGQIVMEVAVVAVVAITLSLFSGNIIARAVSEKMLTDQIIADQANETDYYYYMDLNYRGYDSGITGKDLMESYTVSLDMMVVILFYAVGLGTVCVSTLAPIVYTTRLNPRKILM
ncbi:MAG: ABC transporter permease [Peptococcaceae bacterium]|nr:ABC transporter permease [Peptococcaceae bacterium]